jgi:glycosyltransferase involved in cell wall biosynthesis
VRNVAAVEERMPRACHFGSFPRTELYGRNAHVAEALRRAGWEVNECHVAPVETAADALRAPRRTIGLVRQVARAIAQWGRLARLHRRVRYDVLLVGYPAHLDVVPAALLARLRRRPVVMDAFVGLHETAVRDRALVAPGSLAARALRAAEWMLLRLPDVVLMDTPEHARALAHEVGLPESRFASVPVGADEALWKPTPLPPLPPLRVALWTTFVPLHGMEVVARAAAALDAQDLPIEIDVMGDGQTAPAFAAELARLRPRCLRWTRRLVPMAEVAARAARAHCCLGIFGAGEKAAQVVPYKVHEALCAGRPVVTADTPAARAVLRHGRESLLVTPGDPGALARAIAELSRDRALLERLAARARASYDAALGLDAMARAIDTALRPHAERRASAR